MTKVKTKRQPESFHGRQTCHTSGIALMISNLKVLTRKKK